MGRVTLITGGGRSGKSSYAQQLAESCGGRRVFLATAVCSDAELEARIERHRQSRDPAEWSTVEEPCELERAIWSIDDSAVILVDCLTMWVNNLLWARRPEARRPEASQPEAGDHEEEILSDNDVARRCHEILSVCRHRAGPTIFVTNEVGLGIVPDNFTSRLFRDLLGRCNQTMAAGADEVVLMVVGIPLILKSDQDKG
jgi:adenosylcobinamide kinase/adenosylcobinamide-phosphate guanylyltransferase